MAWVHDIWSQDDSKNFGFPFTSEPVSGSQNPKSMWELNPDINFGFPFVVEPVSGSQNPKSMWELNPDINFGFPYIKYLFPAKYDWIDTITDRQLSDIKNASKNLNSKKKNPNIEFEFTKAYLNCTDLNRIENNTQYLSSELSVSVTAKLDWSANEIPFISDRTRILQNMNDILTKFKETYPETEISEVPGKLSTYSDFNQLEIVQLKIYEAISERSE